MHLSLESTKLNEEGKVFPQVKKTNIGWFPIIPFNSKDEISAKVTQIISIKKENSEADTTALEAEIDKLVYELYNLTEEEIAVIEETVQ